jgi:hypothetical protein
MPVIRKQRGRWHEMIAGRGDTGRLRAWASRDSRAREQLAYMLVDRCDPDELRTRADNGDYRSGYRLAGLLADRNELDELRTRACRGSRRP